MNAESILGIAAGTLSGIAVLVGMIGSIAKAYHRIEEVRAESAEQKEEAAQIRKEIETMKANQNSHNIDLTALKIYHDQVMSRLSETKDSVNEVRRDVQKIYDLIMNKKS